MCITCNNDIYEFENNLCNRRLSLFFEDKMNQYNAETSNIVKKKLKKKAPLLN